MPNRPAQLADRSARHLNSRGFTLLELTIVLVVVGALVALAMPRITSNTAFAEASFTDQIAAALRYAQRYAVSTGCEVRVLVDASAEQLSLSRRSGGDSTSCGSGAFSVSLQQPGQGAVYTVSAPNGVNVSAGLDLYFDAEGVPRAPADGSESGGTVTVADRSITVETASGYVH